jgi:hypothetical protein
LEVQTTVVKGLGTNSPLAASNFKYSLVIGELGADSNDRYRNLGSLSQHCVWICIKETCHSLRQAVRHHSQRYEYASPIAPTKTASSSHLVLMLTTVVSLKALRYMPHLSHQALEFRHFFHLASSRGLPTCSIPKI